MCVCVLIYVSILLKRLNKDMLSTYNEGALNNGHLQIPMTIILLVLILIIMIIMIITRLISTNDTSIRIIRY